MSVKPFVSPGTSAALDAKTTYRPEPEIATFPIPLRAPAWAPALVTLTRTVLGAPLAADGVARLTAIAAAAIALHARLDATPAIGPGPLRRRPRDRSYRQRRCGPRSTPTPPRPRRQRSRPWGSQEPESGHPPR